MKSLEPEQAQATPSHVCTQHSRPLQCFRFSALGCCRPQCSRVFAWSWLSVSAGSGGLGILTGPPRLRWSPRLPSHVSFLRRCSCGGPSPRACPCVSPSHLLYHLGVLSSLWCWATSLWAPLAEPSLEGWCEAAFCPGLEKVHE